MNHHQKILLKNATNYIDNGYRVGLCHGKKLLYECTYPSTEEYEGDWNGISIILDKDMVCLDFDYACFSLEQVLGEDHWEYPMPPSWKEETKRGWHVFYRLPPGNYESRINWFPLIDLLVNDSFLRKFYGNEKFFGHVVCSPTPEYYRVFPEDFCPKNKLGVAPDWLIKAVSK